MIDHPRRLGSIELPDHPGLEVEEQRVLDTLAGPRLSRLQHAQTHSPTSEQAIGREVDAADAEVERGEPPEDKVRAGDAGETSSALGGATDVSASANPNEPWSRMAGR